MTAEFKNEIIRSAINGTGDALETLVAENEAMIYRLCLRICGNPEDASDLTQETFLKAHRSLGSFRGDSRFSAWLCRIASNVPLIFCGQKPKKLRSISEAFYVKSILIPRSCCALCSGACKRRHRWQWSQEDRAHSRSTDRCLCHRTWHDRT